MQLQESPVNPAYAKPIYSIQKSLKITQDQDAYVQRQLMRLRDTDVLNAFKWSEADVVRALLQHALESGIDVANLVTKAR